MAKFFFQPTSILEENYATIFLQFPLHWLQISRMPTPFQSVEFFLDQKSIREMINQFQIKHVASFTKLNLAETFDGYWQVYIQIYSQNELWNVRTFLRELELDL